MGAIAGGHRPPEAGGPSSAKFDVLLLKFLLFVVLIAGASRAVAAEPADAAPIAALRLNQIQVVGTHNSYHVRPPAAMLKTAIAVRKDAKEWDYTRQPLDQQLDQGIRSFELDLHASDSGWQVMHVPIFDPGTTVATFRDALQVIAAWSQKHPRHVPVSLLLELKEEGFQLNRRRFRQPTAQDIERLDEEIRDVLSDERLLVPDDVRGQHATLFAAVAAGAWPTLADAAGQVFVILHETGANRDAYLAGHPALEGRAMFVESDPGAPHAAVLIRNNPTDPQIAELARQGYLVRTRVDSQGDWDAARRDAGLASGAHVLTTDYPPGEIAAERAFAFKELAPARVNPVTGPENVRGELLKEPLGE
ncbi:MAG: phosphatidylinositol-specific phospholipase C1-like protein [Pirellulales bacterium]|nr:phosphatidylinositol-specific phospholipase C1-like protein [Pirellulales bacterium]